MAEEIAVKNERISNFEGLVTLTLDQVILHTIVHHSSTSTNMPNFTEMEETMWTDGHLKLRPTTLRLSTHRTYSHTAFGFNFFVFNSGDLYYRGLAH